MEEGRHVRPRTEGRRKKITVILSYLIFFLSRDPVDMLISAKIKNIVELIILKEHPYQQRDCRFLIQTTLQSKQYKLF